MQIPHPDQLVVIDIETVAQYPSFEKVPPAWQQLWEEKTRWQWEPDTTAADFYSERAGILAEFGKIICISVGYFRQQEGKWQLRLKSFASADEKELLGQLLHVIGQLVQAKKVRIWFAGHNIREFDIPYLCRRLLINGIELPAWLDFQSLKPWEVPLIDTMQLWKFGDYKNYTSLNLLAACMGLESPKDDIDGSMVNYVFWKENDLERIVTYCQKDVATVAQLLLKFSGKPFLTAEQIITV
jgi:hypothetical protein